MDSVFTSNVFPDWNTMLAVDVCMALLAVAVSYIAVLRWPLLARAEAKLGVAFILSGFWCLAGLYIYDLFAMTALPHWIGSARAEAEMALLHGRYSWFILPTSAALIVAGLATTSQRLERLDALLQASKAEAEAHSAQKTGFLASMSHELRTPLNAIMGYAEFMQLDPIAGDKARCKEYAADIHSSAEMLHDLISDLLDLSRIEEGRVELKFERVDLRAVLTESIAGVRTLARAAGIAISLDVPAGIGAMYLDRRAIEQVTLNLVSNSIKHTPRKGAIAISAHRIANGDARITVSDTGTGIPPDILKNIFDPYVCGDPFTRDKARGYGLGLSICKRLVEAHGGSISIESAPGKGTVATVTLPWTTTGQPMAKSAA